MSEGQPSGFLSDLRRRRVFRVLAVYLAGAWIVIEVSETTFPRLGLPDGAVTALVWAAVFLIPVVTGLAWLFQVEGGRVRRDLAVTPRRAGPVVFAVGAFTAIMALGAWWAWVRSPQEAPGLSDAAGSSAIRSIAVLPLDNYSGDPAQDYFAEGITDELTATLATISELRVISRGSAMQFQGRDRPATPRIAAALGVGRGGGGLRGARRRPGPDHRAAH